MFYVIIILLCLLIAWCLYIGITGKQYSAPEDNCYSELEHKVSALNLPSNSPIEIAVEPKPVPKPHSSKPKPKKLTPEEKREQEIRQQAKDIFCDKSSGIRDYSYLDPWEAEEKLERLKRQNYGWIDDQSVYWGLKHIADGNYPVMVIPEEIRLADPSIVYSWFVKTYEESEFGFSDEVWKFVKDTLKPYHEPILLQELKSIEPICLETWMAEKKENGFFFSNKVYGRLRKKWLSQYGYK